MTPFDWVFLLLLYIGIGVSRTCVRHRAMLHGMLHSLPDARPYLLRAIMLSALIWPKG